MISYLGRIWLIWQNPGGTILHSQTARVNSSGTCLRQTIDSPFALRSEDLVLKLLGEWPPSANSCGATRRDRPPHSGSAGRISHPWQGQGARAEATTTAEGEARPE